MSRGEKNAEKRCLFIGNLLGGKKTTTLEYRGKCAKTAEMAQEKKKMKAREIRRIGKKVNRKGWGRVEWGGGGGGGRGWEAFNVGKFQVAIW